MGLSLGVAASGTSVPLPSICRRPLGSHSELGTTPTVSDSRDSGNSPYLCEDGSSSVELSPKPLGYQRP